jgi:hypothetical protein
MSKISGCRPGEKPNKDDKCGKPPVDVTQQALGKMTEASRKSTQRDAKFMIRYRTNLGKKGREWKYPAVGFTNKRDAAEYFEKVVNPQFIDFEMDVVPINVKKHPGPWKIVSRDASGRLITY